MKETDQYKEDWIGLRTLDAKGKLKFGSCPGEHMVFYIVYYHSSYSSFKFDSNTLFSNLHWNGSLKM
jgi:hypothetical protein